MCVGQEQEDGDEGVGGKTDGQSGNANGTKDDIIYQTKYINKLNSG